MDYITVMGNYNSWSVSSPVIQYHMNIFPISLRDEGYHEF